MFFVKISKIPTDLVFDVTCTRVNEDSKSSLMFVPRPDAPLSADGRHLSEVFQEAAGELQDSDVKLATVDVMKDKELAKELSATGPPNIRLYLFGEKLNFVSCPSELNFSLAQKVFGCSCNLEYIFFCCGVMKKRYTIN